MREATLAGHTTRGMHSGNFMWYRGMGMGMGGGGLTGWRHTALVVAKTDTVERIREVACTLMPRLRGVLTQSVLLHIVEALGAEAPNS